MARPECEDAGNKALIGATVPFLVNCMRSLELATIKLVDDGKKIMDRRIRSKADQHYQRTPVNELPDRDQRYWSLNRQRGGARGFLTKPTTYLCMRCMEDDGPVVYGRPFAPTALNKAIKRFIASYRRSRPRRPVPGRTRLEKSINFENTSGGRERPTCTEFNIVDWQFWDGQPAPEPQLGSAAANQPTTKSRLNRLREGDDMSDEIPF